MERLSYDAKKICTTSYKNTCFKIPSFFENVHTTYCSLFTAYNLKKTEVERLSGEVNFCSTSKELHAVYLNALKRKIASFRDNTYREKQPRLKLNSDIEKIVDIIKKVCRYTPDGTLKRSPVNGKATHQLSIEDNQVYYNHLITTIVAALVFNYYRISLIKAADAFGMHRSTLWYNHTNYISGKFKYCNAVRNLFETVKLSIDESKSSEEILRYRELVELNESWFRYFYERNSWVVSTRDWQKHSFSLAP